MAYFPFFTDIAGRHGLIVGGGTVALRKVQKLLPYGPCLTVVAEEFLPELKALETVQLLSGGFSEALLDGHSFVIAATDQPSVNRMVSEACQRKNIPVNVVDDKSLCTFLFPALVQDGDLSIGISTGGASPSAAVFLKEQIVSQIPERFRDILSFLSEQRERIQETVSLQHLRQRLYGELFQACMRLGRPLENKELEEALKAYQVKSVMGRVYLVGAGCGKADLITVRGHRLLQTCDVVVYDDLIDKALLDVAPQNAEKIYMGKRSGHHAASQEEICAVLIEKAVAGKTVVRLKGGDPFVFGRGGEEWLSLQRAEVPCEAVPGITSAIAIPAEAGIPVTYRGLSRSVHIITAHTADTKDGLPEDMEAIAKLSGTLVFLMGLNQLPLLTERLIKYGMEAETPVAVISGGNAQKSWAFRGTLENISDQVMHADVKPPAVIVIGDVAALDLLRENI